MPKCSVVGCDSRINKNQKSLSLHRLPRSEYKKIKWLEAIGTENIKPNVKDIFICSLHFPESAFNRTLDVIRLHDDAIPVCLPLHSHRPFVSQGEPALSTVNKLDPTPLADIQNDSNMVPVEPQIPIMVMQSSAVNKADQFSLNIGNVSDLLQVEPQVPIIAIQHIPSTSKVLEPKIKKLERKCDSLTRKVRTLNEKVRRQKKKIANFKNIIKDLQDRNLVNNESSIVLESCAGPKDFLKRQILKTEGLPLERSYSEETRKFALTLHFFSPKAYDFVRRTYNTCLPHPRTLTRWYQNINAEPGFCQEAFEALKVKVQASNEPVICALIFDEMSIRKSLCWNPQTKSYHGRVTVGTESDNDSLEVANQCFVFLLNCINGGWKVPVGYFFITTLTGEQKAELLKMCIQ